MEYVVPLRDRGAMEVLRWAIEVQTGLAELSDLEELRAMGYFILSVEALIVTWYWPQLFPQRAARRSSRRRGRRSFARRRSEGIYGRGGIGGLNSGPSSTYSNSRPPSSRSSREDLREDLARSPLTKATSFSVAEDLLAGRLEVLSERQSSFSASTSSAAGGVGDVRDIPRENESGTTRCSGRVAPSRKRGRRYIRPFLLVAFVFSAVYLLAYLILLGDTVGFSTTPLVAFSSFSLSGGIGDGNKGRRAPSGTPNQHQQQQQQLPKESAAEKKKNSRQKREEEKQNDKLRRKEWEGEEKKSREELAKISAREAKANERRDRIAREEAAKTKEREVKIKGKEKERREAEAVAKARAKDKELRDRERREAEAAVALARSKAESEARAKQERDAAAERERAKRVQKKREEQERAALAKEAEENAAKAAAAAELVKRQQQQRKRDSMATLAQGDPPLSPGQALSRGSTNLTLTTNGDVVLTVGAEMMWMAQGSKKRKRSVVRWIWRKLRQKPTVRPCTECRLAVTSSGRVELREKKKLLWSDGEMLRRAKKGKSRTPSRVVGDKKNTLTWDGEGAGGGALSLYRLTVTADGNAELRKGDLEVVWQALPMV